VTLIPRLLALEAALYDLSRLALAYLFLAVLALGLRGGLYALIIASAVGVTVSLAWHLYHGYIRRGAVDKCLARQWLGNAGIPLAYTLSGVLRSLPRPYLSWTAKSSLAVAYLNVGTSSQTTLLRASTAVQPATYALSLTTPTRSDLEKAIGLFLVLVGGFMAVYLALPYPIATLYNPKYGEAWVVVVGVALFAFLHGLAALHRQILVGLDRSDATRVRAGGLMRQAILLDLATMVAAYLIATPVILVVRDDPLAAVMALVAALAASRLALLLRYTRLLSQAIGARAPSRDIAATILGILAGITYARASGAAGLAIYEFWEQAPVLAVHLAAILGLYGVVVALVSPTVREVLEAALWRLGLRRSPPTSPSE